MLIRNTIVAKIAATVNQILLLFFVRKFGKKKLSVIFLPFQTASGSDDGFICNNSATTEVVPSAVL